MSRQDENDGMCDFCGKLPQKREIVFETKGGRGYYKMGFLFCSEECKKHFVSCQCPICGGDIMDDYGKAICLVCGRTTEY